MKIDLCSLLPDKMSDESAYHLVNFAADLALALESYYFCQIRRYHKDNYPPQPPTYLQDKYTNNCPRDEDDNNNF